MKTKKILYIIFLSITCLSLQSCMDDPFRDFVGEYCEEGIETTLSLRIDLPEMDVATRAEMPEGADSQLNSLWIGIFNANTGECTYAGYPVINSVSEEIIEPTNDMYKEWDGYGKDATLKGVASDIVMNLRKDNDPNLGERVVIWGPSSGNVFGEIYADLNEYSKLIFEGSANTGVRLIYNRQGMGDNTSHPTEETSRYIDSNGRVEFDLTELKRSSIYGYFHLNSVKIANGSSGKVTSIKLVRNSNGLSGEHGDGTNNYANIKINVPSGPSHIVAVGNPMGNNGYLFNPSIQNEQVNATDLSELLPQNAADAKSRNFNWQTYKNIAIARRSLSNVTDVPLGNLVMSGVFTEDNTDHKNVDPKDWEERGEEIFKIYPGGMRNRGAIHLRRTISQVKFHIQGGDYDGENTNKKEGNRIISVEPQSYRIINAPYTSWLHERISTDEGANSGDVIRVSAINDYSGELNKANYRSTTLYTGNQYITGSETEGFDFDFWMLENKRRALKEGIEYDDREKEFKNIQTDDYNKPWKQNTGIYTALCDGEETMNNSAAFVEIHCNIKYTAAGIGAINKENEYNDVVVRTAEAIYTIHLGGINKDWSDFTHRRNHKYTYNIKVIDIDQIIVEAKGDEMSNESESRPGIEGIVTDVLNPSFELDAHYGVFNICLTNKERTGGSEGQYGEHGFPFRLEVYDRNNNKIIIDQTNYWHYKNIREYKASDPDCWGRDYFWTWVEFRPTTGKNELAVYKPYHEKDKDGEYINEAGYVYDNRTFRLNEIADIENYPGANGSNNKDEEDEQWYTVFINEYVYEISTDESDNRWVNYVNRKPRKCWLNTLGKESIDKESVYIRSKYTVIQNSIQSFYDLATAEEELGNFDLNALGLEHINEVFGLTLRWEWDNKAVIDLSFFNGKVNQRDYVRKGSDNTANHNWEEFYNPKNLQIITNVNHNSYQDGYVIGLREGPDNPYYVPAINTTNLGWDPNSNFNPNSTYSVNVMSACMNRNRDNNGDGKIDRTELRWYLPSSGELVDLVNGRNSLTTPLMDYNNNPKLNTPPGYPFNDKPHHGNTRFHYVSSNYRLLWAEEGITINHTTNANNQWNRMGWQVRCARALGTNLQEEDKAEDMTPAFTADFNGENPKIYPTYFEAKTLREPMYEALPPHQETSTLNRISTTGFEFKRNLLRDVTYKYKNDNDAELRNQTTHDQYIIRANSLCETHFGKGWRLPNIKEAAVLKLALNQANKRFGAKYDYNWDGAQDSSEPHTYTEDDGTKTEIGNFFASTFREYGIVNEDRNDKTGYYLGIVYEPKKVSGDDANPFGPQGRAQCLTQNTPTYYVRCVRDL